MLRSQSARLLVDLMFLPALSILSVLAIPGNAQAQDSIAATLWKWADIAEYDGPNLTPEASFGVVATATFTHSDTGTTIDTELFYAGGAKWLLRFTPTKVGEWTFETSSTQSMLNGKGVGKTIVVAAPPPYSHGFLSSCGNTWCREFWNENLGTTGSGDDLIDSEALVPQFVMYAAPDYYHGRPDLIDQDVENFFTGHGFNGLHTQVDCRWFHIGNGSCNGSETAPDMATFEALEGLITKVHAAGGVVHIWAWGKNSAGTGLDGSDINGTVDERLQRYIASRLGPLPGWTMGYGYDLNLWAGAPVKSGGVGNAVTNWYQNMTGQNDITGLGWRHFLGGRAGGPNGGVSPGNADDCGTDHVKYKAYNLALGYSSYEHHRPDYDTYGDALSTTPNQPVFSEDRFRVREGYNPPPCTGVDKDYSEDDTRRGLYRSAMAGGVANIWGYLKTDGASNSCSNHTVACSRSYRHKNYIRTYSLALKHRLRKDMVRDNQRIAGGGMALRSTEGDPLFIFYQEGTSQMTIDLSGLSGLTGTLPAVAINTKLGYGEIPLPDIDPTITYHFDGDDSDWVILAGTIPLFDQPPFGTFETPEEGAEVSSSIPVTGWALDDNGMKSVKIYRGSSSNNLVYIGDAVFVEGARPDVALAYPDHADNTRAGWGYMLLTNFLPNNGNGTFKLWAIAEDRDSNKTTLGTKTIVVDNQHAVKPFGAIDTPAQGGVASGASFLVWGWALAPQPNMIPFDGSTINVYVDDVDLGHPVYNVYRSDIATLFPGYANSNGAIGYFYLDTTPYDDGVHTIRWQVKDNADPAHQDGVGSRYFTIDNVPGSTSKASPDSDWDAIPDTADNCPQVYNPGQVDTDDDGVGDACEAFADSDGDGIADDGDGSGVVGDNPCTGGGTAGCDDNCRTIPNSDQADGNGDGVGDACTNVGIPAEITSPQPGSTLSGSTVTFQWNSGSGVTEYYLRVGSAAGSGDYFAASTGTGRSRQVSGLPADGSTVHVRLSSRIDGSYQPRDYTYNTICELTPPTVALFERTGEMTGGVPRTRIWGSRGITNTSAPGGTVAVGRASDGGEGSGYTAFRWQNGAFVGLPRAGGGPYASLSWAYGVSADGAVVYGYDGDAGAPVVWTDGGSGWADANTVTLSSGSGWGAISADGSVIVDDRAGVAYRYATSDGWATAGGVSATVLGGMTAANGCSSDCSIVVGTDASGPAIYNGPGGTGAVSLPGAGEAFAVSDDGTVVAGVSPTNVYGQNEPCKWEYAGGSWTRTVLPLLPGMVPKPNRKSGAALAVAADGSRISGHFRADGDYYIPLVWEGGCVFELEDLLAAGGATVDGGWYLADLGAMSPDGRTFGGSMSDQPIGAADDNRHAWIATAGSFTDCNGNGVDDAVDVGNGSSEDCNGNGVPDECEPDSDGDGVIDDCDDCPGDPLKVEPGTCGCGIPDIDSDGDGVLDCLDLCPGDPLKIEPGACGCGVPDVDGNGNGIPDCQEGETTFQRIGEMAGGVPRTRIWGNRGVTNVLAGTGAIAVGRGNDGGEGSGYTAFRWQGGTFSGLPRAGSGPYSSHSSAYGISADGTVVYGYDFDAAAPAVWTDTGSGWANANTVTLNRGSGWGALAADGHSIVETQNGVAYKFTTSNGWATQGGIVRTTLAGMTAGLGSSSDGSIVVGTSAAGPAIYNGPGGPGTLTLPGGGEALAVSDDGTVVAGTSPTNAYGKNEPCKWVYAAGTWTQTTLPLLPGMVPKPNKHTGSALAVAADGQRIAGHFRQDGDYYVPLVWDGAGVRTLESMLNDAGFYLEPGWYLADLGSMSPDGRTFGGSMSDQPIGQADSNRHAWVATVGEGPDGCGSFAHGFETVEEWNFNTHASWPASSTYRAAGGTANEHSGTYGLALSNQAYAYPTTDYVAAGPGPHTISVWNRGEMGDSSYGGWLLRVNFYDSNHQALSTSWQNAASCTGSSSCVSTSWSQRSGTVDAPAGTAYLKIRLYFYLADGWVAYDDVALDGSVLSVGAHGVDGGFETETGWSFSKSGHFPGTGVYRATWGTADQHSGSYGLALSNQAYAYPTTTYVAAGPGSHTVGAWVRGEMEDSSRGGWIIRAYFYDGNHQALSPSWQNAASCTGSSSCVSTTWSEKSGTVQAPAGTAYLEIRLLFYMAGGWVAYDDVALDGAPLTVAAHGVDGGFETATGWSFNKNSHFPGTSIYRGKSGTADQHSGSYGLALSNQAYAYPTTVDLCADAGSHQVSAWVRGEMNDSSYGGWLIRARFYDSGEQYLGYQNAASCTGSASCLSTAWSRKSGLVEAPAGTASMRVRLYFYQAGGWAAYDDVEVTRVD